MAGYPKQIEGQMRKRTIQSKTRKVISRPDASKRRRTGKNNNKGTRGKRVKAFRVVDDPDIFWAKERKRQKMEVKLEDDKLFITLPRILPPTLSRSGKSYLIATTGGIKRTRLEIEGAPVHVVATAFFYGDWVPPVKWVPLIDIPKSEDQDDQDDDEREWTTVPLLE
jgi:hypothetical protein